MPEDSLRVITPAEARSQINHFGRPLAVYMILLMLLQFGSGYIYSWFPQFFSSWQKDTITIAGMILICLTGLILFAISAAVLKLKNSTYLKPARLSFGRCLSLACIGTGIHLAVLTAVNMTGIFISNTDYEFFGKWNSREYLLANILYAVMFIIIRPVCEEYIFRGVIQRQLGHYGRYFGVLASAFLYAIAHQDLIMVLPSFAFGWYLSQITLKYHSIRPSIGVHMFMGLFYLIMEQIPDRYFAVTIVMIILVYFIAALGIMKQHMLLNMPRTGATEWKLWKILLTSHTVILCILLFIAEIILTYVL